MAEDEETVRCRICGQDKRSGDAVPSGSVPEPIAEIIRKEYPAWSREGFICNADLNRFRARYVREILEIEKNELLTLEDTIAKSMKDHTMTARNINIEFDRQLSFGDRVSDRFANFAGSWIFIGIFTGVFIVWILINAVVILVKPFDPYPFILLNLALSALAAIQAPVIIMSQNRQEQKDRMNAEHDYQVNLNAEMEIHQLDQKIDHLLINQGERLLEIQRIQIELIEDLAAKIR